MKLSIVIPNWNSAELLARCLRSLEPCTVAPREVIVIDNGSTRDGSVEMLREWEAHGTFRAIFNHANLGPGAARNQGIAIATGNYLLCLDSDTEVLPGAVERMVETMDEHPEVGLCGARLHAPDGMLQFTCGRFPTLWSKLARQLPCRLRDRALQQHELRAWDHCGPRYVDTLISACHMIRRAALDAVGGYDPNIFYAPEDVDLCLRMWRAGWRVLYEGRSEIIHHEQRITRRWSRLLSRPTREHFKGLAYYFRKHGYLFRAPEYAASADELCSAMPEPLTVHVPRTATSATEERHA